MGWDGMDGGGGIYPCPCQCQRDHHSLVPRTCAFTKHTASLTAVSFHLDHLPLAPLLLQRPVPRRSRLSHTTEIRCSKSEYDPHGVVRRPSHGARSKPIMSPLISPLQCHCELCWSSLPFVPSLVTAAACMFIDTTYAFAFERWAQNQGSRGRPLSWPITSPSSSLSPITRSAAGLERRAARRHRGHVRWGRKGGRRDRAGEHPVSNESGSTLSHIA
jgi:hypothetical protein